MKTKSWVLVTTFIILIFGFTIASLLVPARSFSDYENRYLQQEPEFTFDRLFSGDYTAEYETYITDQFVLRDRWIGVKTYMEIALGKQEINGVYLADDGYLIGRHEDEINAEQFAKNEAYLLRFADKYKELLGEDHVKVMIVPTAVTVLEDKLPAFAYDFDQETWLTQLSGQIGSSFVELLTPLREHSSEYIYYKTDHHWTSLGAYYAYCAYAKACGFTPLSQEKFTVTKLSDDFLGTLYTKVHYAKSSDTISFYNNLAAIILENNMSGQFLDSFLADDKLSTRDQYAVFLGGNYALSHIQTETVNGKTLLLIKDSYANCFLPMLTEHYEEIYVVDLRYFNMALSQFVNYYGVTDVAVLYSFSAFATDQYIYSLAR